MDGCPLWGGFPPPILSTRIVSGHSHPSCVIRGLEKYPLIFIHLSYMYILLIFISMFNIRSVWGLYLEVW